MSGDRTFEMVTAIRSTEDADDEKPSVKVEVSATMICIQTIYGSTSLWREDWPKVVEAVEAYERAVKAAGDPRAHPTAERRLQVAGE